MVFSFQGYAAQGGEKEDKVTVRHCGCNEAGTGLEIVHVTVNKNACKRPNGHANHTIGSEVMCELPDGTPTGPFTRTFNDRVLGSGGDCGTIKDEGAPRLGQPCSE